MNQNVSIYYQVIKKLMNNNISDDGILYYIALKSLYNPSMEKVFINANTLYYQLYNTSIKHDKNITKVFVIIENALKELEHIEVIKILSTTEHNYLIDMSGLHCEYSYAMKSLFREIGNQMSGTGNHHLLSASLLAHVFV